MRVFRKSVLFVAPFALVAGLFVSTPAQADTGGVIVGDAKLNASDAQAEGEAPPCCGP